MCVNAKRPYDACLGIADLGMLQRTAFSHGRVRNLDCAVSDIFLPGLIQAVEYEPRSRDIRQGPVIDPSPFKNAVKFGGQSEVRVLFVPKEGAGIMEERVIIELPNPALLFDEIFRNYSFVLALFDDRRGAALLSDHAPGWRSRGVALRAGRLVIGIWNARNSASVRGFG
jgi:hypothetical protein